MQYYRRQKCATLLPWELGISRLLGNGSHPTFLAMRLLSGIALKNILITRT